MTPVAELTHSLSVAGQIQPEDVKALAEREIRVLARQTAMTEEMDALRGALESERARRVAAEARTRALEREKNAPTSGTVGTPEEASPPSSR